MERQKYIYAKFQTLWANKILCFVDTPWGTFENMAIQTISTSQSEDSKFITDISVTFQKINFTSPKYAKFDSSNFKSGTASAQHSEMVENGKTQGKVPDESVWYQIETGKLSLGNVLGNY